MRLLIGVCDDEEYQIKLNSIYLCELARKNKWDIELHGFKSGEDILEYLGNNKLDILILDIDLAGESGLQLASKLLVQYPSIAVIFVTGHREFALDAFNVEAIGYLLKPYDLGKLERSIKKAVMYIEAYNKMGNREIVVIDEYVKKKISIRDIIYVQRQLSRSVIYTNKKKYAVYETMTSLEERLGDDFIRVNQSEIIAKKYILEMGKNHVALNNGKKFFVGRSYKQRYMDYYKDYKS